MMEKKWPQSYPGMATEQEDWKYLALVASGASQTNNGGNFQEKICKEILIKMGFKLNHFTDFFNACRSNTNCT